jgi:hypothetical protein
VFCCFVHITFSAGFSDYKLQAVLNLLITECQLILYCSGVTRGSQWKFSMKSISKRQTEQNKL